MYPVHHAPRKRFGQHFLHDKLVIQRIVESIDPEPGQVVVEIGPGQGALTVPLLKILGTLHVIELDYDLIPALQLRCASKGHLIVHQGDALEVDFSTFAFPDQPVRIVGNLPYNISTPLIFHLLQFADVIGDMHFMLQKEVVERLAAAPGGGDYGRLSVMVQYHAKITALFNVGSGAFYPPPQVESSVVRIVPYKTLPVTAYNYAHFATVVKEAFAHRRKILRNSLKSLVTDNDWQRIAIDPHLRPEQLSAADFVKISNSTQEK